MKLHFRDIDGNKRTVKVEDCYYRDVNDQESIASDLRALGIEVTLPILATVDDD